MKSTVNNTWKVIMSYNSEYFQRSCSKWLSLSDGCGGITTPLVTANVGFSVICTGRLCKMTHVNWLGIVQMEFRCLSRRSKMKGSLCHKQKSLFSHFSSPCAHQQKARYNAKNKITVGIYIVCDSCTILKPGFFSSSKSSFCPPSFCVQEF